MAEAPHGLTPRQAQRAVLGAIATGPYCTVLRLSDELALDLQITQRTLARLEATGLIERDDTLAWAATHAGRRTLVAFDRRATLGAWFRRRFAGPSPRSMGEGRADEALCRPGTVSLRGGARTQRSVGRGTR